MGTLLRYPYEVRDEADYFDDIPNIKVDKEALELARHIVKTKTGHFHPDKFEDRYESALRELIAKKQKGEKIEAPKPEKPSNVVSLMDALRRSVDAEGRSPRRRAPRRAAAHPRRSRAKRSPARARKAG
jgi:DNA end-binding protein Ku